MTTIRFPGELPLLVGPDRQESEPLARTLPALAYAKMPEPLSSSGPRKGLTDPLHAGSFAESGTGTRYPVKTAAAGPAGPQPAALAAQVKIKPPVPAGSPQPQAQAPASAPAQPEVPGRREAPTIPLGGLQEYLGKKPTPRSVAYLLAQGYPWQEASSGDHRAVAAHLDQLQPTDFWKVAHFLSGHLAGGVSPNHDQAQQLLHEVMQSRREAPSRPLTVENQDLAHTVDVSQLKPRSQKRVQALLRGLPKVEEVPGAVYIPKGTDLQALLGDDLPVGIQPLPPNRTNQTLKTIKDTLGNGPDYKTGFGKLKQVIQSNPHLAEWLHGQFEANGPPTPEQLQSLTHALGLAWSNSHDRNWKLGRQMLNALPDYHVNEMDRFLDDFDPNKHPEKSQSNQDDQVKQVKQLFVNKLVDQPARAKQTLKHLETAEQGSLFENTLDRVLNTAILYPSLGRWLNAQIGTQGGITPLQLDQLDDLLHSRLRSGNVLQESNRVLLKSNLADLGALLSKYRIQGPDPADYPSPTADPVFAGLLKGGRGQGGKKNYQRDGSYWIRRADLLPLEYAAAVGAAPDAAPAPQDMAKPSPVPKAAKAKVATPKATSPKANVPLTAPTIPPGGLQQHLQSSPSSQELAHTLAHGYDWHQATPADHLAISEHLDNLGDSDFWETVHHTAQHLAKGDSPHPDQTRQLLHGALWGREEGTTHPLTAENRKHAFVVDTSKLGDEDLDLEGQQRADMLLDSLPKVEGVKNGVFLPKGLNLQALLGNDLPVDIKPLAKKATPAKVGSEGKQSPTSSAATAGEPKPMLQGKPLEPDAVGLSKSTVDALRVAAEGHPRPDALQAILSEHHSPMVPGLDHWLYGQLYNHGLPTHDELTQLARLSDAATYDDNLAKDLVSKGQLANLKPLFQEYHVKIPKPLAAPPAPPAPGKTPTFPGKLQHLQNLGGSTGAKLVQDQAGQKWVQKYGENADHVREEVAADDAYRALGVPVPPSTLYKDKSGKYFRLSQYIPGKSLGEFLKTAKPAQKKQVLEQVRQHFVADALLNNLDVTGMDMDNLHVGDDGQVYRIDNGGALRFRAQGRQKVLDMPAWEVETMRDKQINPEAASLFKEIPDSEIIRQVHALNGKRAELLAALPKDLREPVGRRLAWLAENFGEDFANLPSMPGNFYIGKGRDWRDVPPEPSIGYRPGDSEAKSKFFRQYQSGAERPQIDEKDLPKGFLEHHEDTLRRLPKKDRKEIENYTGEDYQDVNEQMRNCPETLDCLDAENRKKAESLQKSIAAAGKSKVPYTVWRDMELDDRHERLFANGMKHALKTGEDVRLPGFKSSSYSPDAYAKAGKTTGDANVHLEIRTRSGLVVQSVSAVPEEKEVILPHNARYRMLGIEKVKLGDGKPTMVYQLEEL